MDPEKIKDEQYATDVDEILEKSGPCGIFQIGLQILFMFFVLVFGYEVLITYFTGIKPSWSCTTNSTSEFYIKHINRTFHPNDPLFDQRCQLERNEWNYTTPIDQSFVSEFDLVYKQDIYVALTTGTFFYWSSIRFCLSWNYCRLLRQRISFNNDIIAFSYIISSNEFRHVTVATISSSDIAGVSSFILLRYGVYLHF